MFDIGFFELIMIAIVLLLVVGPERLPDVLRKIMLWRGRIQRQFSEIKTSLENEIGTDEIRQQLHNEAILKDYKKGQNIINELSEEMQSLNISTKQELEKGIKSTQPNKQ